MSAYARQIEREFSAQSISSRGESDRGSGYTTESGLYMTSFAATIFIAALATIGILMVTLLITLTVMLQSCESRSAGIIENKMLVEDYNRCKFFALHSELNSLATGDIPSICKSLDSQYIKGQYARDLNDALWVAESYFSDVTPLNDNLDVVLMDVDDVFASNSQHTNLLMHHSSDSIEEAKVMKCKLILKLYMKLQARGWNMILFSRMPEKRRSAVVDHLVFAGYRGWSSLIMRLDSEVHMDSHEFFSSRRKIIQEEGFRIEAVISSQMDALTGPCLGKRIFKFPNPI